MSKPDSVSRETTLHVRDHCLCFAAQRAARRLGRRFDEALKPLGLTNGQFSMMMALNRPDAPTIGALAEFLVMDRTTLTAALKPLQRRGLVEVFPDPGDRRRSRLRLLDAGRETLAAALPVWRGVHAEIDADLGPAADALRDGLRQAAA